MSHFYKSKTQEALDRVRQKHGLAKATTDNTKSETKSDKGKQNNSAPSAPTNEKARITNQSQIALERVRQEHGLSEKTFIVGKSNGNTKSVDASEGFKGTYTPKTTTTKPSGTTTNKSKVNYKTTITSNLSESERQKRIKEVKSELNSLGTKVTGYSRAKVYGANKALLDAEKRDKERMAELSAELKALERTGTFTQSEMLQWEIDDARAQRRALPTYNPTARMTASQGEALKENVKVRSELDAKIALLETEQAEYKKIEKLDELNAHTKKITSKPDFKQNSKYSPRAPKTEAELKAEGYKQDAAGAWYKRDGLIGDKKTYTGEDSDLYTYLNDVSRRSYLESVALAKYGTNTYKSVGYHTLTDEEIGAFNYLYHQDRKNGTNTAETYLQTISPLLQQRALEFDAKRVATIAKEAPVSSSIYSFGTNAANAMMFPTKVVATATGMYDDMPSIDMFGNQTQAIRGAVSEDMSWWGKKLYDAGMSIGDMGVALALGGGKEKVVQLIMSSSAGSSAISEAKKNGASDGKALVIGLGSAAIEAATEKYSIEAILKNPKTTLSYIVTNALTESTEEGASNIANLALDTIVSEVFAEPSEIEQRMGYLMYYEGMTKEEAFETVCLEKLQSLGEDALVGFLSGFGMSSAAASPAIVEKGINGIRNRSAKNTTQEADTSTNPSVTPTNAVTTPNVQRQASAPDTLEQAAKDVVASRNTAQTNARRDANKGTPLAERLEAQSQNNEPITVAEVKKATGFGEEGSKLITELANSDGVTFSQAERTVKTAYLAGYANVESAKVNFATDTQINAFTAGKKDRVMDDLANKEKAKNATVYDSGVVNNDNFKKLSTASQELLSTLANDHMMSVEVRDNILAATVKGKNYYASASHQDGKMTGSMSTEKPLIVWAIHEDGHRMEQMATDEWNVLANALYERAESLGRATKLGVTQGLRFDAIKAKYDEAGQTQNTSGYFGEVVMRELETIFASPEEFNTWRAELDNNAQVKTAWQRFMDFLYELIEDIRRVIANRKLSKEARAEAKAELAELERIKELYAEAYKATRDAVAERAKAKSAETKAETTTEAKNKPVVSENESTNIEKNEPQAELKGVSVGDVYAAGDKTYIITNRENGRTTYTVTDKNGNTTTRETSNVTADINFTKADAYRKVQESKPEQTSNTGEKTTDRMKTILGDGEKSIGIVDGQAYVTNSKDILPSPANRSVFLPVNDVNMAKTEFGATESDKTSANVGKILASDFTPVRENFVDGTLEGVGEFRVFTDENGREIALEKNVAEYFEGYNLEATFRGGKPYAIKAIDNDGKVAGVAMAVWMDKSGQKYGVTESKTNYSLEEEDIDDVINQSMTMEQAKDMIQRAFVIGGIKEWFDGEYQNGDEWLRGEGADAVALVVENEWTLQQKFLDKIQGVLDGDFYAVDIIEAYEKGTLTGKVKQNVVKRLDTSKSAKATDTRAFAPKEIKNAQEIYKVALERVTNSNREKVYQARADIIMFAHNRGAAEALGLTQSELNKKLSTWARYTARAKEVSMRINKDVALFNRWTGIENSNVLNRATVSQAELDNLVNEIKGDSNGWQRSYIMRTMLALDTHIDYSELNFEFVGTPKTSFDNKSVNGLYDNSKRKITVKYNAPHTVAHEMGHFLDYQWARDFGLNSQALTDGFGRDKQTDPDVKQFLTNFDEFIEQIEDSADLRSGYTMDRKEVFARFVAKFVQWVDLVANGQRSYAQEYLSYNDKFTASQYIEFVRLLQEKSMLDSKRFEANETNSAKNLEIKIKEEYNGSVNYLLNGNGKTKSEQYGVMWTLDMGVLDKNEVSAFYEKISETHNNKYQNYREALDGQLIYEIENKLIYTDGDYDYPHISKVIAFNTDDSYFLEYGRECFYDGEKYGYSTSSVVEVVEAVLGEGNVETTTYDSYEADKRSGKSSDKRTDGTEVNQRSRKDVVEKSFSLKDSDGKSLTKEQAEYFKDSKIRDGNGNLLVMYHGTIRGGFTVFGGRKDYWYFTNDKKYSYAFEGRKKNGQFYPYTKERMEKGEITPQRYKVYLNVTNPYIADIDTVEDALYWDKSLASLLREKGYDALMVEDMSQVVVLNENQIKNTTNKNPTDDPDINYSLEESDNISTKDRKELLDIIEHLKSEFELTKFAKADQKKLAKMTRALLKEYNSQAEYDETFKAIDELYNYMANGEDGHPPVWEDVYSRAYNIAHEIVENAVVVDDYTYQEYKHLRDYLRKTPMKFDARYNSVPSSYENFNEFRKHNMGRLKFTKDGMSIDSVYQELANLYPEFFDAEEQMNSADQLDRIEEVLYELQPTEVNPFDRQIEQVAMYLASDLTSRFFDIPQTKPTFADKAERRVMVERAKGNNKVERLREQKDAKIKKLIEAQKEKTKKQIDKIREQRDTKVKKEQEKRREAISKMSESQKAKMLRARIIRHTSDLTKKLVNPTDNQHIPYELQGAVAKLLECINLESNYTYDAESDSYKKNDEGLPTKRTQAFHELQKVYADIASSVVVDPDLMGEQGLLSDVISLADKRIVDMTSSELETVWRTIRAIEASVSSANKLFSAGKFAIISDVAEDLRAYNEGKKSKTELKGIAGKGKKLATLDMLTPETYLHFLGGAGDSIFRMMRDAQDKHISIMKEVSNFTHKELKDVNVNKLEKTLHTVKLGGEDVQLSTAQIMELYVLMKREQAREHILIGGILPDVTKGKGMKLNTKTKPIRNISVDEISAAVSKLTDEQRKVADKLQKYVSSVLSAYGNEASMQVYNYEKFNEENYWTIRTNKQEIKSDVDKDTSVTSVANKGMTKATKPHANTSVRVGSIFDTFASHSSDMATYAAWLGTSEDVNRIRNFVFWENGARTGTVKDILDTVHGIHGSQYLEKLLTDISIGVKGTDNLNPFDKLVGNYKAASVGANLRVIIQQPTAILRAMDMIGAHRLAEGAIRPLKGWAKAKKYAPIAQWKDWGYFDINTGRQMKDVLFDNASLLEKTKQAGMWGASMADSLSWGLMWNAVEAETKAKHKELEVGSDKYYETVAKRFTEIVDHTQVVDGILQRSQVMRSADNLTKMATSFMGEPTKQYNMAVSAAYDAKNLSGDARKKAVGRLGRTAMSLAVAGIVNACAQSIIDAMRDDDKEKDYWEKWMTAFVGDGEEAKWYDTNLVDTINPLNYVPFAKDIVSIFRGYDVKRMDTEAITKVVDASKNMYKSVTGEGKYTIAEASAQLLVEIARLFGLPVANVKRDVKSLVMSVANETDSYLMQYRMEKAMLNINYAGNSKNFMDILFNAYNNDREAYEFIYDDMLESGYEADKIKSGMETRMMKAEGVEKTSELSKRYMTPDDENKYDSSLRKVKSSNVWKSANATQRKEAEADLYSFLTSTSEAMEKARAEAREFGVDETEYTLWQLAIEMADQPKGQKGSGSYDYKEKAEAINSLNLGDSEIAYFFGKGLNETSKEELNETIEAGIDIQEYVNFKAAASEMKADKNAKGNSIPNSKKRKVVKYLNNADLTKEEWNYFYYEIMNYKK